MEAPPSEMQSIWVGAGWEQWGGPGMGYYWAEIRGAGVGGSRDMPRSRQTAGALVRSTEGR